MHSRAGAPYTALPMKRPNQFSSHCIGGFWGPICLTVFSALAGCSSSTGTGAQDGGPGDGASPLPAMDAAPAGWALYTIEVGDHDATLTMSQPGNPIGGFSSVSGRDYQFRLNPSAMYVITHPVQPDDQLDWNKLPGISDCGTVDLSVNGAMFGWRWRLDTNPNVLEVTAYANNNSMHLWPQAPLFTLDADDLASDSPVRYRVWIDGNQYQFAVSGQVRGRTLDTTATLSRACASDSPTSLKWAAGFYFGGTSTAPSQITGHVSEIPFM